MADIPGNSTTKATISVGGTLDGDLEVLSDQDWYRLQLTAGQQITILLTGVTLEDPYLRIRDSAGNIIFENDDISAGSIRDSRVSFTAPSSGTFYVDVGAWVPDEPVPGYTGTGTYQLSVQPYTPPPEFNIDQVAEFLTSGYWNGEIHPFNITQGGSITVNVTALTPAGKTLALTALGLWSDVIGVSFTQVTTGGQIVFDDNQEGAFADNVWADGFSTSSHVNVDVSWLSDYGAQIGGYAFQAYIHEIGHALGLGHAGYYNMTADYFSEAVFANDGWPVSIMSYFDQNDSDYYRDLDFSFSYLVTPMIGDIAAMQLLYGLSTTTRLGNTTYGFNSNAGREVFNATLHPDVAYTIIDSGGVDTLDYSGFSDPQWTGQYIDLTPGSFSNVGGLIGNVAIALGTVIENAIGGSTRDTFILNAGNNRIEGGAEEDTVSYAAAAAGVRVNLSLTGAQNTIGAGTDTLLNIERLIGSDFDDVLTGGLAPGEVFGGSGNDVLTPGGAGTALWGEAGDDRFISAAGHDYFIGGDGYDTADYSAATSGAGGAFWSTTEGFDTLVDVELVIGSSFDDVMGGHQGAQRLVGGAGNDIFNGTGVRMEGGTGNDTYRVNGSENVIIELPGEGIDTVEPYVSYTLPANVENLTITQHDSIDGTGNELNNAMTGNVLTNRLSGLDGDDILIGGAGIDTLTGGAGADSFRDTAAGLSGDTITDFTAEDRIVITDASLAAFSFAVSGSTLTYSGGSLTLAGGVTGTLVASAAAEGGVQLALSAPPPPPQSSRAVLLLTEAGQDFDIGGNVRIIGTTAGGEEITVLHGNILLDASFNAGGDTVVLPGSAASYSATLSGSIVTITNGSASIAIPVGVAGITIEFADASRTLQIDTGSSQVVLGGQAITSTTQEVAPATTPFTGDGPASGPESVARLILTESGQDIDIGGNVRIVGTTAGGEVISVLHGTIQLDASFNAGGDTVVLGGAAADYVASLSGSIVTIAGGDTSVGIPVGLVGISIQFSDVTKTLRFDPPSGKVLLDDQVVTSSTSAAQSMPSGSDAEDGSDKDSVVQYGLSLDDLSGAAQETFALEPQPLAPMDYAPSVELHRFEFSDSFYLG